MTRLLVLGGGGHAKVVLDVLRASGGFDVAGLVCGEPKGSQVLGLPVLGGDDDLPALRRSGVEAAFVAVGDNALRLKLAGKLRAAGFDLVAAVHPSAVLSPSVRLGRGVVVMPGAALNADTRVDDLAIVNTRASVDHDGHVGEAAHVAPGCALAGNVTVGRLAFLGVGASAIPGVRIGEGTVVGAGACVVSDLPPRVLAAGVPARVLKDLA